MPAKGSPASAVPLDTIGWFLGDLGRLREHKGAVRPGERRAAIVAFRNEANLPVSGEASLARLGRLIQAAH